jgi:hypothetical protein
MGLRVGKEPCGRLERIPHHTPKFRPEYINFDDLPCYQPAFT